MNLHKNTLLYRMKQLYQTFEMEQDSAFVREFFIRMLLEYRRAVKARTAWNKKMQFVQRMNCDEFGEWISFSEKEVFVCQVYLFLA